MTYRAVAEAVRLADQQMGTFRTVLERRKVAVLETKRQTHDSKSQDPKSKEAFAKK